MRQLHVTPGVFRRRTWPVHLYTTSCAMGQRSLAQFSSRRYAAGYATGDRAPAGWSSPPTRRISPWEGCSPSSTVRT